MWVIVIICVEAAPLPPSKMNERGHKEMWSKVREDKNENSLNGKAEEERRN